MTPLFARRKVLFVTLLVALLAGSMFLLTRQTGAGVSETPFTDLRTVLDVIALVKTEYVDPSSASDLLRAYVDKGTINGMLQSILDDPYTRHLDIAAFKQMQIDTTGVFAGIGIMVGMQDEKVTVIAPIENTPGWKQGLKSGDRIVKIDGRSTALMGLDEAVSLMRGKEGTTVTLTVERGKKQPQVLTITITRAVIQVPSVPRYQVLAGPQWPTESPVGYIRLSQFAERTSQELDEALQAMVKAQVKGLILDLRSNPGGLLTAAIEVADKFLSQGPIVHIVGRESDDKQTYNASADATDVKLPLIVLVDEWSASASEIVSGALQDRGVATLVGQQTFGKGLVQAIIPLRDGSALSLTSARYQTAGGRFIHKEGIKPDYVVELTIEPTTKSEDEDEDEENVATGPDPKDTQLCKALQILQGQMLVAAGATI